MKAGIKLGVILMVVSTPLFGAQTWHQVHQLCGTAVANKTVLAEANYKVFRARAKHLSCCEAATEIARGKTDTSGKFFFAEQQAGQYFVVFELKTSKLIAPLWLEQPIPESECILDPSLEFSDGQFELVLHPSSS